MKMIKKIVDHIDEELKGAEHYAEEYIYAKSTDGSDAQRYHTMSEQELEHAIFLHDRAVKEIEKIRNVYKPSQEMLDKWSASHTDYVQKVAMIRMMLER